MSPIAAHPRSIRIQIEELKVTGYDVTTGTTVVGVYFNCSQV